VMKGVGIPPGLFPPLRQPGQAIGPVTVPPGGESGGLRGADGKPLRLIAVGSHDTASAVVAVPAAGANFAYISSGTWSLVGLELTSPVVSQESRLANFTNEAGIDETVRYLRNVSGLWLLQECQRSWGDAAGSLESLLRAAADVEPLRFVIDADDPVFLPPGDMPGRIAGWLAERGLPSPSGPAEITRCILDSLALAYRRALLAALSLSGRHADLVHIVGGGSRNELLCQLTADATGLPVLAGPAEATVLGNILVQARALGAAPATLSGLRTLLRRGGIDLRCYSPAGDAAGWHTAARRIGLAS
ncbi:MAG: FGGY-family carbohydrate kinase, partial [Trebonia sp.]